MHSIKPSFVVFYCVQKLHMLLLLPTYQSVFTWGGSHKLMFELIKRLFGWTLAKISKKWELGVNILLPNLRKVKLRFSEKARKLDKIGMLFLPLLKGQLILKCLFDVVNFTQNNLNDKIWLYYNDTPGRLVFVLFWEKLKTPKRYFEINWPLVTSKVKWKIRQS